MAGQAQALSKLALFYIQSYVDPVGAASRCITPAHLLSASMPRGIACPTPTMQCSPSLWRHSVALLWAYGTFLKRKKKKNPPKKWSFASGGCMEMLAGDNSRCLELLLFEDASWALFHMQTCTNGNWKTFHCDGSRRETPPQQLLHQALTAAASQLKCKTRKFFSNTETHSDY